MAISDLIGPSGIDCLHNHLLIVWKIKELNLNLNKIEK